MKPLLIWVCPLICVFLAGCAATHRVTIDSIAKPHSPAVAYSIGSVRPGSPELRAEEHAVVGFVKTALSGRGLYEAATNTMPDMVIDIDFGISPPRARREYLNEPVIRTTPPQMSTSAPENRIQDADGRSMNTALPERVPAKSELVGHQERVVTIITYDKYLRITARENVTGAPGRPAAEIWTVDVTSEGESRDLAKKLPVLVAATTDQIGAGTRGLKTLRIKDTDTRVVFVKKEM